MHAPSSRQNKFLREEFANAFVQDNIFMQIRGEGLDGDEDSSRDAEKVLYVLHPNCAVEEM